MASERETLALTLIRAHVRFGTNGHVFTTSWKRAVNHAEVTTLLSGFIHKVGSTDRKMCRKKLATLSAPLLVAGVGACGSNNEDDSAPDSSGESMLSAADDGADNDEENTSDDASEDETASADTSEWMPAFEAVFELDAEAFYDVMEESVGNNTAILP